MESVINELVRRTLPVDAINKRLNAIRAECAPGSCWEFALVLPMNHPVFEAGIKTLYGMRVLGSFDLRDNEFCIGMEKRR